MERPVEQKVKSECDQCGQQITIVLKWWTQDGGKTFQQDTPETVDVNERLCKECLDGKVRMMERASRYMSDTTPEWFDPTYAGERWDDNY